MQMPRNSNKVQQQSDQRTPNVYWRSVSTDTLRANERYLALPPVTLLASTDGAVSHRYVRQESPLWTELHDGMLTTGRLKQALGMHEAKAAQVVGIHPGSRGSSHLLSAYFHLLTTAADPTSSTTAPADSAAATAGNEAARQQFNEQLATAAVAASGLESLPAALAGKARYSSIPELQQICQSVALSGDIPVKMYWGKVQESAALYILLQIFPAAIAEEVGLFELDPETLPASWGWSSMPQQLEGQSSMLQRHNNVLHTLPRLGASPDGLLVHRVTFSQEDLQIAADRLAQLQPGVSSAAVLSASQQQASSSGSSFLQQGQQAASSSSQPDGVQFSEQEIVQCLLRQALDAVHCAGTRPPVGVPTADTSESSCSSEVEQDDSIAAANSAAMPEAPAGHLTHSADVSGLAFQMDSLSILQQLDSATPPAAAAAGADSQQPGSLDFQPIDQAVLQLLQQYMALSSSRGSSSNGKQYSLIVREVVEVKNHCPFALLAKRKGKKGKLHVRYSFRPRGPAQRVHPQWVPQLQMHMLASGCQSALLVSRCPYTGVRVFRMWRDDAYLQTMLQLLQVLQTEHVLPRIHPSADTFRKVPIYKSFLHRTSAIARSAVCVAAGDEEMVAKIPVAADGSNVPRFW